MQSCKPGLRCLVAALSTAAWISAQQGPPFHVTITAGAGSTGSQIAQDFGAAWSLTLTPCTTETNTLVIDTNAVTSCFNGEVRLTFLPGGGTLNQSRPMELTLDCGSGPLGIIGGPVGAPVSAVFDFAGDVQQLSSGVNSFSSGSDTMTVTAVFPSGSGGGGGGGAMELNRIDLDNGGDALQFINTPYLGSDPAAGNFSGDFYWKVIPRQAVQNVHSGRTLWGTEQHLFDLDWSDFSPLWAYMITTSVAGTDLGLEPVLSTGTPGVLVPEVSNTGLTSPSPGSCPKPGYVGGWVLSDLFADTATGSLIPLMQGTDPGADDYFLANGFVDWSFVHFFPGNNQGSGPQAVFQPSPNGCGSGFSGSASFQWFRSQDGASPFGDGGENQGAATLAPTGSGTGTVTGSRSRYGGFHIGGTGTLGSSLIPEEQQAGADLAFFFGGMTLSMRVNTQYTIVGAIAPEVGLAGLEFPIGWDTASGAPALKDGDGGVPGSTSVTLGVLMYNQSAGTTPFSSIGAFSANLDFPGGPLDLLIDQGICFPLIGGIFGLNPANPLFASVFNATLGSFTSFTADPANPGEVVYISPQFPLSADPTLLGVRLGFQGWEFVLTNPPGSEIGDSSGVVRMTLRDNTGVD